MSTHIHRTVSLCNVDTGQIGFIGREEEKSTVVRKDPMEFGCGVALGGGTCLSREGPRLFYRRIPSRLENVCSRVCAAVADCVHE